ncbi:hexaprenyl-diphosphate synthase small subunit [Macrococcus armenti]|uniref:hexaprenyl-diphosphate synthase small subunit n=1 Tax=Macrococcus armenti TaxID=2875764 RepID=UPI001CCF0B2A|nr:hexaprenyl-diphosphate synthase small subunit [Macrococcus armenti]UBH07626.1 hypothetical protein LAU41_06180 [Macrococcus armenti]UBH09859.1 hypothetical protein LAU38_06080 [Macrococcus armenti]
MRYLHKIEIELNRLTSRYPYFKKIAFDAEIIKLVDNLNVDENVKCAIVAIDTSMRMQDFINEDNKDNYVLSTDVLSALFYKYLSEPFYQHDFLVLTDCVSRINELKSIRATITDEIALHNINKQIHYMFIQPFMNNEKVVSYE